MANEFIYGLYHIVNGEKNYFYVGRSEREVGVRFDEHRKAVYSKRKEHQTDVYNYIREKVPCAVFDEDILCWVVDYTPVDNEDFWVIEMIKAGYELQNMKHGDQRRMALMNEAHEHTKNKVVINSVKDLVEYRAFQKSEALRKKILDEQEHRPEIKAILANAQPTREELAEREKKRLAKARRQANAKAAYAEHLKWLEEQSRLFENGEIDALGNKVL